MQKADFFALSILVCVVATCGKRSRFCTPSDFTAKSYRLFDEFFGVIPALLPRFFEAESFDVRA